LEFEIIRGEAAFYGPKLDIEVETLDGKNITLATIQIDLVLPEKFGMKFVDKDGIKVPALIHHSPIGTYQRFIALLLEQNKGRLPF
jgi:threonyl-tRNA synthetase